MYSRRFYGGDRMQRGRPVQTPAVTPERTSPVEKKTQITPDTFPRWAVDIPVTEEIRDTPRRYTEPRDFTFEKEFSDRISPESVSVYPENPPVRPDPPSVPEIPDFPETFENGEIGPRTEGTPANADIYEKNEDIPSLVRSMTLEDMMLTGLLMMGSSGEYDDEIMLILGLILMIGA